MLMVWEFLEQRNLTITVKVSKYAGGGGHISETDILLFSLGDKTFGVSQGDLLNGEVILLVK